MNSLIKLLVNRTYTSHKTGSPHTYRFYSARRNDPKWRPDFLQAKKQRNKDLFILLGISITIAIVGILALLYVDHGSLAIFTN